MKSILITPIFLLIALLSCGGNSPEGSLESFLDAPDQDNYEKFLRYSLKAQMLDFRPGEGGLTAERYFEKWKNDRGEVKKIEEFGPRQPYLFENLFKTEAITYTVTHYLDAFDMEVDNNFQVVLITEKIKDVMPWLRAEVDQWVVMDNLFN